MTRRRTFPPQVFVWGRVPEKLAAWLAANEAALVVAEAEAVCIRAARGATP